MYDCGVGTPSMKLWRGSKLYRYRKVLQNIIYAYKVIAFMFVFRTLDLLM